MRKLVSLFALPIRLYHQPRSPWLVRRLATAPPASGVETQQLPSKPSSIQLRQYQEECIQSVLSALQKGHKRLGISLATGGGKTVIFTRLIDRIPPPRPHATQTLILVHRRELVEQAARHCIEAYPSKSVEIEMANSHASGRADITIASVRSIISSNRMAKFDPSRFKLVLVDEAHHIVAQGYMNTLNHFGLLSPTKDSPALVGVSATLSRFDGLRLGAALDHIVYHKSYVDMIGEKWLTDVIFTTVESKADISKVRSGANGDFRSGELSKAINTERTNEITVRAWLARARERKSTIVFCVDVKHITSLTATFRRHGIDARFITGSTHKAVRGQRLDEFRNGEFPVLLNCGVFTEGTDIPNIDCVLLARPTKSRNLLVQMIGRGMRLHSGKTNCHIIDMVSSLSSGVVTTPTLFGLDPSEIVDSASPADMKELQKMRDEQLEANGSVALGDAAAEQPFYGNEKISFTDYDSVYDLVDDTSGEQHIRAISRLAWVEVGPNRYVLSTKSGDFLMIEKTAAEQFHVRHTAKIPLISGQGRKSPFMRPREIAQAETFSDAVHAADTYASETFQWLFISKDQAWRKKPASEGQVAFLNNFRAMDDQLGPEDITKGKAGDMITKIKFGARGRYGRLEAARRRQGRAQVKLAQEEELKQREDVKVGPVSG
ncbi:DEAD/DEAH box helicase-like protein [Xylona heveae TC161]|uniref:DEAD/DEAH box helicase-like protein n=1 Tax=Xylona heveae (strain CBS 132557 / TC161) TaxID=1328760 RepID=A0A165HGX3_XYLHT|nr:DEAD/DEAH box helicase-like protein [Xylona heveae TC161]KZF23498.1 DEAD/DEAH box helicase-like protein [Xylona heveae TC161]